MTKFRIPWPLLAALAGAALLGGAPPARADFTVTLHEANANAKDLVITDNSAKDFDPAVGSINFSGTFGDFKIQSDFATSTSQDPTSPAELTINQFSLENLSATGPAVLTITVSDTFSNGSPGGLVEVESQLSTTSLTKAGDTVAFQSFLNGVGNGQVSLGTAPSGTSGVKNGLALGLGDSYTLSNVTTVSLSPGGKILSTGTTTVATGTTTVVPAPAGAVLALSALPLLAVGHWLRRRKALALLA